MNEKYKAVLLGCAIGDTLGMPVEGWKREQIKKYVGEIRGPIAPVILRDAEGRLIKNDEFGKLKYYTTDLKRGEWTDDTILTLALAESIIEKGLDLEDVAKRHVKEYESRLREDGYVIGGFGGTTTEAIQNLRKGISPKHSGVIGGPGNAPAMKMSPLGIYMHAKNVYNQGLEFAQEVGKITHLDPRSLASGVVQAHAIYILLKDIQRIEFVSSLTDICKKFEKPLDERFTWYKQGDLLSRLNWIKSNIDANDEEAYNHIGVSSAVYKSYPFALFMFQKYWNSPLEGLLKTVNYGGDCDTTGAIFGSLAGAKRGIFFPEKWLDILDKKDRIIQLADELSSLI